MPGKVWSKLAIVVLLGPTATTNFKTIFLLLKKNLDSFMSFRYFFKVIAINFSAS